MTLKVSSGTVTRPQKVVVYGPEGIGKSTFASKFPSPLFLDIEKGTSQLDIDRLDWSDSDTWTDLLDAIKEISTTKHHYKTIVIDTADKAEQLCMQSICEKMKVSGIEDIGYGKGYTYIGEEFAKLLSYLDNVIKVGINVVILAHAKMRKFEQPDEMGAYDRWELKLTRQAGPLLKEWADMLLFCNYKTSVAKTKEGAVKAQGGKRVMYTSHHPCWDAKNRHGLADVLNFDYGEIKHVIEGKSEAKQKPAVNKVEPEKEASAKSEDAAPKKPKPIEVLRGKMLEAGIEEFEVQQACAMRKLKPESIPIDSYADDFIQGILLDHWDAFHNFILKSVKNVPSEWVK